MTEAWAAAVDKMGAVARGWATYAALGTFLLYLFGYLTLRFQLMAYGVVTNLDAFDEKYFFAGCSFTVNFFLALLNLLFVLGILGLIVFVVSRPVPKRYRERARARVRSLFNHPLRLLVVGSAAALLLIQVGLRQCLMLHNLLTADELPDAWISGILQAGEAAQGFYFTGLVAGTALTGAMLGAGLLRQSPAATAPNTHKLFAGLLSTLIAIEFLFLPINFGMLVSSRQLPRVAQMSATEQLPAGSTAWLLWETKDVFTFLLLDNAKHRSLITMPRKDHQISIVGNDAIFQVIFPGDSPALPAR